MRWLLINPRPESFQVLGKYEKMMTPFAPMGISYLAAVLEAEGAEVVIFDGYTKHQKSLDELIKDCTPDVVGISCLTPTASILPELTSLIREISPKSKIVLGHIHATLYHKELLSQGLADFILRGEAEESIAELNTCLINDRNYNSVKGLSYLSGSDVTINPDREVNNNLDKLPMPAWHLLDINQYIAPPMFANRKRLIPVLASRGCPYRCYFCAQNIMAPTVRTRNIVSVVDEIELSHESTGVDLFWFSDAIFPLTKKDAEIFCSEMVARGLNKKVKWITETRVNFVDKKLLRRMKEAGLHMIMYGLESGDEKILSKIKAGVNLESGKLAVEAAREADVLTLGLFIVGLPGETRETINNTIEYSKSIGLDFAKFNRAVPYPGSPFFTEICGDHDDLDWNKFSSWYEPDEQESIIYSPDGISTNELIKLQKKALFSFYVRPKLILRHLFKGSISPLNMARGGGLIMNNYIQETLRRLGVT